MSLVFKVSNAISVKYKIKYIPQTDILSQNERSSQYTFSAEKKDFVIIFMREHIWASFVKQNLIEIRRISNVAKNETQT